MKNNKPQREKKEIDNMQTLLNALMYEEGNEEGEFSNGDACVYVDANEKNELGRRRGG